MNPDTLGVRHSIRRSVNLALAQIVIARLLVTVLGVIGSIISSVANLFNLSANAIFTIELEGARRYETLTGVRLGFAIGQPGRYTDLHDGSDERFPITMDQPEREESA